jgi:hypothetical protein
MYCVPVGFICTYILLSIVDVPPPQPFNKSLHIGCVIRACLAYTPTSVIIQFLDYFNPIPITVVAFILALV